jgi:uncharacterized protein (TIGR02597 family)
MNTPLRPHLLAIATASLLTLPFIAADRAFAQAATATTDPVGFTTVTVPANSIRALSRPLDEIPKFAAGVSARTTNTITTTGAGWTANAYGPFGSNPHLIRVLSGTSKGRQFRIVSNTTDTLTLTTTVDLSTVIANNDRYEILPVPTLASVFGQTGAGLVTNADPTLADNVQIRGTTAWITYYNDGSNWLRQGPGTVSNTTAILPENGLVFVRRGGSYDFTNVGAVPTTNLQTELPANRTTSLSNRFPVATKLVGLGLQSIPGWNSNADPALADNVLVRGTTAWITYYYDGSSWIRQGPQTPNQNPTIGIGTSVVVVRRAGTDVTLNQALPYTL